MPRIDVGHSCSNILNALLVPGLIRILGNSHLSQTLQQLDLQSESLPKQEVPPPSKTTKTLNHQTTNHQTTKQLNHQTTKLAKDGSCVGNRINNGRKKEEVIIEEYPEIDPVELVKLMMQKRILPSRLRTMHCCCIVKAFALYFQSNVWGKLSLFSRLLKEGLKDAVDCGLRALQKGVSDFGFFGHQKTEVSDCWEKHRQEKYDCMSRLINTIKAFLCENVPCLNP